jgi:hypothetical protein
MTELNREFVTDPDNQVWEPPEKNIVASCYMKPESVEISLPKSPTGYLEAEEAINLSDME